MISNNYDDEHGEAELWVNECLLTGMIMVRMKSLSVTIKH